MRLTWVRGASRRMAGNRSRAAEVATAGSGDRPYRPMPMRTRSRRASGCHSRPAVAARCRTRGLSPASATTRSAARKRERCFSVEPEAGSSARDRWLHSPTMAMMPSCSAALTASASAGRSAGVAPPRDMPVSTLRWIRAGPGAGWPSTTSSSSAWAAATIASSWARVDTDRSMPAASAARSGEPVAAACSGVRTGRSQHSSRGRSEVGTESGLWEGRATPAASSRARRCRASASWATPSQVAPARRQVVATGAMPWP